MTKAELAAAIRKKHPGAYDQRSDEELVGAWVKKYPTYGEQLDKPAPSVTVTPDIKPRGNDAVLAATRAASGAHVTPISDSDAAPSATPKWDNALVGLEDAAASPLTGLGAPVDSMFGSQAAKLASKIPFRSMASGALNKASSALDYVLPSWATPKKSILEKIATTIGETPKEMPKGYYGNMPPTPEKPPIFGSYDLNPKPPTAPTTSVGAGRVSYTPSTAPTSDVPDIEGFSRYEIGPQQPQASTPSADPMLDELKGVPYAQPTAPVERGNLTAGAQSPDELERVLTNMLNPQGPMSVELPPQPELAGGGPFKQSGKFGKSGNLGQAKGYSSGMPSVPEDFTPGAEAGYSRSGDDLARVRNAYSSGDATDPAMMASPEDMGMGELPIPDESGVGAATAHEPVTSLADPATAAPAATDAPSVMQDTRHTLGHKDTAALMGVPQQAVLDTTENMRPRALPTAVRERIAQRVGELSPEGQQLYLDSAPNEMTAAFIRHLMGVE